MGWAEQEIEGYVTEKYKWILVSSEELSNNPLFEGFKLLDQPQKFSELFLNQNFEVVEVISILKLVTKTTERISGFSGLFEWKDNKIESLDGDSYNTDMTVYGYKFFEKPEAGVLNGLFILVGADM